MAADRLLAALDSLPPTWRARFFSEVDSTQDEAKAAARAGAPSRSIFVADYQREGRGRQGRRWVASPGSALMLSMLFRESTHGPVRPWRWTSLASLALVEAVERIAPTLKPAIKWPNDVMLDDRKVAGILAESSWNGRELQTIVGAGINVNSGEQEFADLPTATSLRVASRHAVDRGDLLLRMIERIDYFMTLPLAELHRSWQSRLWGRGQRLRLLDLGQTEDVVVLGADLDGSLRVRLADGTERRSTTGELLA